MKQKQQTHKEKLEEKLDMKETEALIEMLDKEDKTETKLKIITTSSNRNEHKATLAEAEIAKQQAKAVARVTFWASVISAVTTLFIGGATLYREEIGEKILTSKVGNMLGIQRRH